MQGFGKRALCLSSTIPVLLDVSKTFTSYGPWPRSHACMSLLKPLRFGELMLTYRLLSWEGERAPVSLMWAMFRSLGCHVIPAPVILFLASFEALRERKRCF